MIDEWLYRRFGFKTVDKYALYLWPIYLFLAAVLLAAAGTFVTLMWG